MNVKPIVAILLAGGLILGAACAGTTWGKVARGPAYVEVHNANLLDADVYLLSGGQQHRLGLVVTNARERFRVAPGLVAPPGYLRVAADLMASNAHFVSEEIALGPGDVVRLVVQPDIDTSYVVLR